MENDSANPCARLEQRIAAHHGQGFSQIRALLAFMQAVAHRIPQNSGLFRFCVVSASRQTRLHGHPYVFEQKQAISVQKRQGYEGFGTQRLIAIDNTRKRGACDENNVAYADAYVYVGTLNLDIVIIVPEDLERSIFYQL